jgi:hypothetical protein
MRLNTQFDVMGSNVLVAKENLRKLLEISQVIVYFDEILMRVWLSG